MRILSGWRPRLLLMLKQSSLLMVCTRLFLKLCLPITSLRRSNWDAAGMTDEQISSFIGDLAKLGFTWQFITLAGFHSNALITDVFACDYAKRGMLAYVQKVQREERNHGVETLAHQKWSGAEYYDNLIKTVQGGMASTAAMGHGVTESQFH
ncbi:isocitrate lyase [Batrachochytrium salamandrivorans]|nr:isocitrate lyase [Batrachochytrium salamandrivorans]